MCKISTKNRELIVLSILLVLILKFLIQILNVRVFFLECCAFIGDEISRPDQIITATRFYDFLLNFFSYILRLTCQSFVPRLIISRRV